jgi:MFS family permease
MSSRLANALVFFTAAAVLVLEILAGRLMAPYVGVTLETFTGIIGTVLAGISIGAWAGGRLADRIEPAKLLGPILISGGVLALLAPPIVHIVGPSMRAAGPVEIVLLTVMAFFLPAAVLSGVTPIVVKIRLTSLAETGVVVGTYSAVGTAGAIFGTFITGFVLIAALPSRPVVFIVSALLILSGIVLWIRLRGRQGAAVVLFPAVIAAAALFLVEGPCDTETSYFCAYVTEDPDRPTGRVLWLDTLRHSYVDLADPTFLEFRYAQNFERVIDAIPPGPLDVLSIGGGGFTFPQYLEATRPGTRNTVLEIDGAIVDIAERNLGLDPDSMTIRVGDARVLLNREAETAFDLVIGDAFGGLSVPWHLTTREFVADIHVRLRPDGVYLLNMIDYPPLRFAKAEIATIGSIFEHVLVIAPPEFFEGARGGNFVIAASDRPWKVDMINASLAVRGGTETAITGAALDAFVDDARTLTDEFAPVDQLISRP